MVFVYNTTILSFFFSGTVLCVFLRGVGVVGQAPARDATLDPPQPEVDGPRDEKGSDLEANQK